MSKPLICLGDVMQAYSSPAEDPELRPEEKKLILAGNVSKERVKVIPWGQILSKAPVWALIVSHFCHNWGTFILLTWMPTYYNQVSLHFLEFKKIIMRLVSNGFMLITAYVAVYQT